MKKILFTIVIVISTTAIFAQYQMNIKKADNTTETIWIHDIDEITFTDVAFTCGTSTITYAGKTYNTVLIGSQCWLKENLDIGTRINGSLDQTNNSTIEKYCYNDDPANCTTYGGLYQWDEAMQYVTNDGSQGICPNGWHIPTLAEFQTLSTEVGGDGNALKEIGQGTGGGAGTNTSGFSALLAGFRWNDGAFYNLGIHAYFWSSLEGSGTGAYFLALLNSDSSIVPNINNKIFGCSVRCVKD
jgi:uncharacterized protein (TIGR02145 family)